MKWETKRLEIKKVYRKGALKGVPLRIASYNSAQEHDVIVIE